MLPDRATMYIAGAGQGALDIDFWQNVYGFSYRCFLMLHSMPGTAWPCLALHQQGAVCCSVCA